MSNHQKRLSAPKRWPIERKTETFTVKADAGPHGEAGVPLLVVLRDVLGYADSRKEARYALDQDNVVINGTAVSDEERPVGMFDILAFDEREEYYRVFPGEGGRLALTPIDADAAGSKLGKIVGKRHVPGGDVQLTLHDGQTLLVEDDYEPGDSLVVANEDSEASDDASEASGEEPRAGEIVAHFEYEEGALVTAVAGSHAGEIGAIEEIQVTPGSSDNNVIASQEPVPGVDSSGSFETIEDYVVVIDENFIEGDLEETDGDEDADLDEKAVESETEDESADAEADSDEEADAETDEEADAEADSDEEADASADDDSESDGAAEDGGGDDE